MIRTEREYKVAVAKVEAARRRLADQRGRLEQLGLDGDEVKRVMDPMESFHLGLTEDVESYQRWKRGQFDAPVDLSGLGQLLIAVRIAQGVSQRELAERLEVHESQVSRDERNDYHGITVGRAVRILEALRAQVDIMIDLDTSPVPVTP